MSKKIQYYEVVIKQEGFTREFIIEAAHHMAAIKQFKTFVAGKTNKRPHYSELFYGGEFLSYIHYTGEKTKRLNQRLTGLTPSIRSSR